MGEILSIYNQTKVLSGIYKINFPNGKCYIGQSSNIIRRMREHNCTKKNYPICNAIQKYGPIKEFEFLEEIEPENLAKMNEKEQYYINFYNSTINGNGYNIAKGGEGARRDYNDPIILEIKQDLKNNTLTEQEIAQKFGVAISTINAINTGKTYHISDEDYPIRKEKCCNKSRVLTEKEIDEIITLLKENYQLPMREIAQKYNIHVSTVESINRGEKRYIKTNIQYPIREKGECLKMFTQDQIEEIIEILKIQISLKLKLQKSMDVKEQ